MPEGDLLSFQALRIAAAIAALMVGQNDFRSVVCERYPLDQVAPRMAPEFEIPSLPSFWFCSRGLDDGK